MVGGRVVVGGGSVVGEPATASRFDPHSGKFDCTPIVAQFRTLPQLAALQYSSLRVGRPLRSTQ